MSRWNLAWLLGIPLFMTALFTLAYSAPVRPQDQNYHLVRQLVDVLAEVDSNYVRELDTEEKQKLVLDMINGGLYRLDPYSAYFNPEEYSRFLTQSDGNFGGIGVQVGWDPERQALRVLSPMVGTPAYEAGMLAGDLILKVDGRSIHDMTQNEAIQKIMGKPGSEVTLTVLHESAEEAVELTITRAIIEIQTVMGYRRDATDPSAWEFYVDRDNGIAYVRLEAFNEHTASELRAVLTKLQEEGARSLILDLRDNPGGLLSSAIEVSDLFLESGTIVSTRNRRGHERAWSAGPRGTLFTPADRRPIVVLLNHNSASAAEIVSAALQDHGRAVVIGERSFGKGSVQKVIEMPYRDELAALKLTTDSYWRPNGKNIHRYPDSKDEDDWGVRPDDGLAVEISDEERLRFLVDRRERESVRGKPAALPESAKPDKDGDKEGKPFVDSVLKKAIERLKSKA